ncbi:peptidoglycan DD-metalloendopeptidase family protein [Asticcacaulis machinosus]|uniref:Peptidoglycan DD-metalloendopeptidase family protein n=1 Tax=Asticcacaulis machinosus TaxID=2984211 RepID=A0ABT5HMF5_9CAUL|nr:peptidoglycan DD-metalloendopeptidase family protein [Asticcacaulis machinosus]MDC7677305.1 peptidoglycan DD-metalloendopeptidase family protein [Asticcacaulis machinosus]
MDMAAATARFKLYQDWLAVRTDKAAPVIDGMAYARPLRLDAVGMASEGWSADMPLDIGDAIRIGGYDEDRALYDSEVFAAQSPDDEPRTVHLALDIWAPAGTKVHAPLHGRIHSFQDNDNLKDYGPTIILEHMVTPDLVFWTLYGHLSRDSLEDLYVGKDFVAGDVIASLGAPHENGGWTPHLHVQVILDIGDKIGDFPGVFRRRDRDYGRLLCPDPRPLLGI